MIAGIQLKTVLAKKNCVLSKGKKSRLYKKMTINVIFLYNLDIFVQIQHFWGLPLNSLISEPSCNQSSYKVVPVYLSYFCMKTYVVGAHYKCLGKALVISATSNIYLDIPHSNR